MKKVERERRKSSCNYKKEMKIGAKIEMEHTKNPFVAKKIARDHLKEFKCYYTKGLIPMERRLRRR